MTGAIDGQLTGLLIDLMKMKLKSAEVGEFIPDPAIDLWLLKSLNGRRLHQRRWAMKKSRGEKWEEEKEQVTEGHEQQLGEKEMVKIEEMNSDGFSTEWSSCESPAVRTVLKMMMMT